MKKTKFTKLFVLVIIVGTLLVLTTTAMADTKKDYILWDPCDGYEALPGAEFYCGEYEGGGYQIEIPDNWNGDLLVWAHGYHDDPTFLWVVPPPLRDWLIENGYAWGASSFTTNGYDVTTGVKDTKTLVKFFQQEFGETDHVYISGESMGGTITAISVEQWPGLYNGGMSTSGSMDPYLETDLVWDFYVLINALGGFEATYPIPRNFVSSGQYQTVLDTLTTDPEMFPFSLNEQGILLKNAIEMRSGGERPIFDQAFLWAYDFLEDYIGPLIVFSGIDLDPTGVKGVWQDNWETVYQFDMDPALTPEELALNELVFRIERDPQVALPDGIRNVPVPTGKLKNPIISLHGIGDMLVPFSVEQSYAQKAADNGASNLLVVRAIRNFIHGAPFDFTPEELTTAFSDLVEWVETGVKPDGDDILDPAVVSDPYFGCQFSSEDRDWTWLDPSLALPPCP